MNRNILLLLFALSLLFSSSKFAQNGNAENGAGGEIIALQAGPKVLVNLLHHLPIFNDANLNDSVDAKEYFGYLPLGSKVGATNNAESIKYYGKDRDVYQIFTLYDENSNGMKLVESSDSLYALAAYLVESSKQFVLLEDAALFSGAKLTAIDKKGRKVPAGTYVAIDNEGSEDLGDFVKIAYVQNGYVYRDKYIKNNYSGTDSKSAMAFVQIRANLAATKVQMIKDALQADLTKLTTQGGLPSELVALIGDQEPTRYEAAEPDSVRNPDILNFSLGTIPVYAFPNPYASSGYIEANPDGEIRMRGEQNVAISKLRIFGELQDAAKNVYVGISPSEDSPVVFVRKNRLFL